MELIRRLSGLGKIAVSVREDEAIRELYTLAPPYPRAIKYGILPDSKEAERFKEVLEGLFPHYPLVARSSMWSGTARRRENEYFGIGLVEELEIDSRLSFDENEPRTDTSLRILKPDGKELEYFMTVMIDDNYVLDCRDDVAQKLGQREKPPTYGLQQIPERRFPRRYGIAEVNHLKVALYVLNKAARLVRPIRRSLNQLRRVNPEQYERDLERLINQ